MNNSPSNRKSRLYQMTVTVLGLSVWAAAAVNLLFAHPWQEQTAILLLTPLMIVVCMFQLSFRLPRGLKFTNVLNFSLSDAIILLIACWYGVLPAAFIAGIEGYASSRRAVRRTSSNLFSAGMMTLVALISALCLAGVLRFGFGEVLTSVSPTFPGVAVALLAASVVHIIVNCALLFTVYALRQSDSILRSWKEGLLWAVPMFLPTSAAASLMHLALQYNVLMTFVIGAPTLLAIYLSHRQHRNGLQERIEIMEQAQAERIRVTEKAHRETIEALAVTINAKDEVTHEHVLRVQIYANGVAQLLGCTTEEIAALKAGALLHDIGKIGVPDTVLNKPGKLTPEEFEQMKLHTLVGAKILARVEFPYPVVPIVRSHHERWDGRGYPDGLKGEDIPLTARILSVVDCFDALREDRPYRLGMTREEAIELLMQGSGTQYDPRIVGAFITHLPAFEAEIRAHRNAAAPTFNIALDEGLSEGARLVPPAAGFAETPPVEAPPVVAAEGLPETMFNGNTLNVDDNAPTVSAFTFTN